MFFAPTVGVIPGSTAGDSAWSIDDSGTVLIEGFAYWLKAGNGAVTTLPSDYVPVHRGLGHAGHVLLQSSKSAALPQIVFNTRDGTATNIDNSLLDPSLGWDLSGFIGARPFDRHGRLIGRASLKGTPTHVILTPKSQPLP